MGLEVHSGSKHLMENTSPVKEERDNIDELRSPWDISSKEYKFSHELLLNDLYAALQEAIKSEIKYKQRLVINSWQLDFGNLLFTC